MQPHSAPLLHIATTLSEVPCKDCNGVYVGETGRTLKKWISEHKQAVRHMDDKNGIAVHIQRMVHRIDREKASITATEEFYWKRRIQEALQIQSHPTTMNLDCRLSLNHFWFELPLIKPS